MVTQNPPASVSIVPSSRPAFQFVSILSKKTGKELAKKAEFGQGCASALRAAGFKNKEIRELIRSESSVRNVLAVAAAQALTEEGYVGDYAKKSKNSATVHFVRADITVKENKKKDNLLAEKDEEIQALNARLEELEAALKAAGALKPAK